ncbi:MULTISPECIES: hypothetical protein [unclassified Nocardioides]|uniref:hypothetical protein n=1 Tax=unclassified Nocardioides TaxID=2615069 RepID=UPI0006F55F59|nr:MULTISPECIES: hypothetical protein [unclassified Nocardioides]KRA38855.1 hypothetical protein ASD81_09765 [Nocardioides sp. Root614]KRA92815.1 hypothetical protein ASD84_10030 [Nocardioides sp. Root682]
MSPRGPLAGIALALVSVVLAGCTFSSGSSTEITEVAAPGQEASGPQGAGGSSDQAPDRKAAQPTPSAAHVSALCDSLTAVYLTNISDAENAASIVNDWVEVTAAAPASLKDDLNTVGAYLVAAAKGDYARIKGASDLVGKALDQIDKYVTKVCRA